MAAHSAMAVPFEVMRAKGKENEISRRAWSFPGPLSPADERLHRLKMFAKRHQDVPPETAVQVFHHVLQTSLEFPNLIDIQFDNGVFVLVNCRGKLIQERCIDFSAVLQSQVLRH